MSPTDSQNDPQERDISILKRDQSAYEKFKEKWFLGGVVDKLLVDV